MNGRHASTANWRPLLVATAAAAAMLLATGARGTAAHQRQPAELSVVDALPAASPCGSDRDACDWSATSEQHAAKRQNVLDELLLRLADRDGYDYRHDARDSGHVPSRFAAAYVYGGDRGGEQPTNRLAAPQLPFAAGWKSRYAGDAGGRVRLWRPFNGDNKRARYAFSSWGGKRSSSSPPPPHPFQESAANVINVKREPSFSSWGGKRTQRTFFNWGGKRSIPDDQLDQLTAAGDGVDGEHSVMKRDVGGSGDARTPTLTPTSVGADAAGHGYDQSTAKRLCIGGGGSSSGASGSVVPAGSGAVGGSGANTMNLQQLFNEFVEWSRKQPEQKKAPFYRKMFNLRTLHSPDNLSRRAGSFYPWGGKRNAEQKGD